MIEGIADIKVAGSSTELPTAAGLLLGALRPQTSDKPGATIAVMIVAITPPAF